MLPDILFNTVLQAAITSCLKMAIFVLIPLSLNIPPNIYGGYEVYTVSVSV